MASIITRMKDRVHTTAATMSPTGRAERKESQSRAIPPEPVQQLPEGELTSGEADPAVQVHNLARANKMVPKIAWDDRIAHDAETYAKTLASTGKLEHSDIGTQGENLYLTTNSDAKFEEAVEAWLDEEKHYNKETIGDGNLQEFGHFTQCLWHSTTHVGMGKAISKDGRTYIVARYSPRGNVVGERPF